MLDKPTDRTIFQNAWVVDDAEAACTKWVEQMGIGPFFLTEYDNAFEEVTYRGEPAPLNMIVAIAQAGPVQITGTVSLKVPAAFITCACGPRI